MVQKFKEPKASSERERESIYFVAIQNKMGTKLTQPSNKEWSELTIAVKHWLKTELAMK